MTTISMIIPPIVYIFEHLQQISNTVTFLKKMLRQLDLSVHTRFTGTIKRLLMKPLSRKDLPNDPIYFVTTWLNPKFKFHWISLMNYNEPIESNLKHLMINMVLEESKHFVEWYVSLVRGHD
jgi:hypothetical protein